MNESVPPPLPPPVPKPQASDSFMYAGIALGIASVVVVAALMWFGFSWLNRQVPGAETIAKYPELRRADPEVICQTAFGLCSSGRQNVAEDLLDAFAVRRGGEPQLWFMRGVLARSRFAKESAAWCFERMLKHDRNSPRAEAARLVMELDRQKGMEADFQALKKLAGTNPDEPLILWLLAIECREQDRGEEGEAAFRRLAAHFEEGPVMFHQTFANVLLHYQNKPEEALGHFRKAVAMEPKGWSLQALGVCLEKLDRLEEAEAMLASAVSNSPAASQNWDAWAGCLMKMGRLSEALPRYEQAAGLDPGDGRIFNNWGEALEVAGQHEACFGKYAKSAELKHPVGMVNLANCLLYGRGCETNFGLAQNWTERAYSRGCTHRRLLQNFHKLHAMGYARPRISGFLGSCYFHGQGVATNLPVAAGFFTEAAEGGETGWLSALAQMVEHGRGVPQDASRALELHRRHADTGSPEGCNGYAWMLATSTNPAVWNGPLAVEYALKAVGKNSNDLSCLDTLAAAHARAGNFTEAAAVESQVVTLIEKNKRPAELQWLDKARARVGLYRSGKAYVEQPDA